MRALIAALGVIGLSAALVVAAPVKEVPEVLKFKMKTLQGKPIDLAKYQGKVLLVVNVASKCGATPQYKQLEALHEKYGDKGLVVLGVPCNQFGGQEPGTEAEIAEFCSATYGVKFDMLGKVDVNGDKECDLYKHLKAKAEDTGDVKWNFEKFLVGRDGKVLARFRTKVSPDDAAVVKAIEGALADK